MEIIPIITLDRIYIAPDEKNIYFLDCTRINGTNEIIARKNESLNAQILRLSQEVFYNEIFLADDVVFSGNVLRNIIKKFNDLGITVIGIITSICTSEAYEYFNSNLRYGVKTNYIMSNDVIDQICERDFYFGIAGSGILVKKELELYKSPYFIPYGSPSERASIPLEYERFFSKGCLDRSIYLWEEIDKLKRVKTKISELPEKILNTNENEEVVKVLKRERKRI